MQAGIWKLLDECVILQTKSFNVLQFRLELQNCIALQRSGFKVLLDAKSLYISPPVAIVNSCDCKVCLSAFDSQSRPGLCRIHIPERSTKTKIAKK